MSRHLQGEIAEEIAIAYERLRLGSEARVKYVGDRHGLGFDIESCDSVVSKTPRYIEVKSVSEDGSVFLTERERVNLMALGRSAWLYAVDTKLRRVVKMIQDPLAHLDISKCAITYKVKI